MARKRISAQNIAIFAGPSPAISTHTTSNIKEIYGVQSFSYDLTSKKEDVAVLGKKANLARESAEPSVVSFDFSYYLSNLDNETSFGFNTAGTSGTFAPILDGSKDERNFFIMVAGEGQDAIGASPGNTPCLGFGNSVISSYNFNAAVGSYPTVSVSCEAVDAMYYADSDTELLPSIDVSTGAYPTGTFTLPTATGNFAGRDPVLRPGDITVNLSGASGVFHNLTSACVQSVDIGVDLTRNNKLCLGQKYRSAATISDAVPVTFSVEILAKDMVSGRMTDFTCLPNDYRAIVSIKRPSCDNNGALAAVFDVKGLSWENQSQSVDLGADSTVTINFQGTLGGANDLTKGVFTYSGDESETITVADEAERFSLTGILPGQLVFQTGNSTTYRLLVPSEEFTAVNINDAGISEVNGIYTQRGESDGKAYYNLLNEPSNLNENCIIYDGEIRYLYDNLSNTLYTNPGFSENPWNGVWENSDIANDPPPEVSQNYIAVNENWEIV